MMPRRPWRRPCGTAAALWASLPFLAAPAAASPAAMSGQPVGGTPGPSLVPLPPLTLPPLAAPSAPPSTPGQDALPPVFQPSLIPLGHDLLVGGAVDLRTRTATTGRTGGVWINSAEVDLQRPITARGTARGNVVLQLIAEDPPDIPHGDDAQLGEAYLLYRLPVATEPGTSVFVKAGQFQLPFGLLASYDPHLSLLQPLSDQSLGLRTDWGLALTGTLYGALKYDFALTTGSGPNHAAVNTSRLITARLGRSFSTRNGLVTVGSSLLSGRLPVTDLSASAPFAVELPPSGRVRADREDIDGDRYTPKSRIGVDGTYHFRAVTARGEAVVGADKDNRVQGYHVEGGYAFTRRASAVAAYTVFVYPVGDSNTLRSSGGLSYSLGHEASVSGLYQYLRDVPRGGSGQVRHRLTLQFLLRF